MTNKPITNILIIALLILFANNSMSQEWTEPINISNIEGTDRFPDITVSADGTMHCVWDHEYYTQHRKIFYSFSTDNGLTWSTPEDVSKNETLVSSHPHIVCDSENNLYVTYNYNAYSSPIVVMQKYDGENWGKMDSVADAYSHHSKLFIDNKDRVYVFWRPGVNKIFYKYLENNVWSDLKIPYDIDDSNLFSDAVIDKENNIHVHGYFNPYSAYFKYNKSIDEWETPKILTSNVNQYVGSDITVDSRNYPHVVWHERTSDTWPYNDATIYRSFNGMSWDLPETVVEDPYSQNIVIYNSKIYIFNTEKEPENNYSIVLYQRDIYGYWYGTKLLTTPSGISIGDAGIINNSLYIVFYWKYDDIQYDVFLLKTKHPLSVKEINNSISPIVLEQNYPNPVKNSTTISYTINQSGHCNITILNLKGQHVKTLVNKKQGPGNYNVKLGGKNAQGKKLKSGIYLYRLSLDNYRITKSMIIN